MVDIAEISRFRLDSFYQQAGRIQYSAHCISEELKGRTLREEWIYHARKGGRKLEVVLHC